MQKEKLTSLADLRKLDLASPAASDSTPPAPTRKYATSEAVYIAKLYALYKTHDAVGGMLGVTGGTIGNAIRTGKAATQLELAAKGEWYRLHRVGETEGVPLRLANVRVITMVVASEVWETVKPWLEEHGAKHSEVDV